MSKTFQEYLQERTSEDNMYKLSPNAGRKDLQRELPDEVLKKIEPLAKALKGAPIAVAVNGDEISAHYPFPEMDGRAIKELSNLGVMKIAQSNVKGADMAIFMR